MDAVSHGPSNSLTGTSLVAHPDRKQMRNGILGSIVQPTQVHTLCKASLSAAMDQNLPGRCHCQQAECHGVTSRSPRLVALACDWAGGRTWKHS